MVFVSWLQASLSAFCIASFLYAFIVKLKKLGALVNAHHKASMEDKQLLPSAQALVELEHRMFKEHSEYHHCLVELRRRFNDMFYTLPVPQPKHVRSKFTLGNNVTCSVSTPRYCLVFDMLQKNGPPSVYLGGVTSSAFDTVVCVDYTMTVPEDLDADAKQQMLTDLIEHAKSQQLFVANDVAPSICSKIHKRSVELSIRLTYPSTFDPSRPIMGFVRKAERTIGMWRQVIERCMLKLSRDVQDWQQWNNVRTEVKHHFVTLRCVFQHGKIKLERYEDFNDWYGADWGALSIVNLDDVKQRIDIDCHLLRREVGVTSPLSKDLAHFALWCMIELFRRTRYHIQGNQLKHMWSFLEEQKDIEWFITEIPYDAIYPDEGKQIDSVDELDESKFYMMRYIKS